MSAIDVKKRYEKELLDIKGVTGVGFNGSINVYVERLTPQLSAFIPDTLEGVPVHIIETGKIRILSFPIVDSFYGSRVERIRPPIGGTSIGHQEATAGTLCSGVRDKMGDGVVALSNNHVVALQWGDLRIGEKGDPILQPGVADGGGMLDKIGELLRWEPVSLDKPNKIDGGIFSIYGIKGVADVGKPSNAICPEVGTKLKKSGRTTGLTFGRAIDVNATVSVEGYGEAVFEDQIIVSPAFSAPGDSGSWVGDEIDRTVGIVFAGSTEVTIVNKATNVEEILGVQFAEGLPYIPVWEMVTPVPAAVLGVILAQRWSKGD